MIKYIPSIFFLLLTVACNNRAKIEASNSCFVNYDSLLQKLDTSRLYIEKFGNYDSIEVRDTSTNSGEGSVFHFDKNGKLGLYAFMYDWPFTSFTITYSPTGEKHRQQTREVVQWQYEPEIDSIIKLRVLLCAVDRNYGNLKLSTGLYCDSTIKLFETPFSKIIYFKANVPVDKNLDSLKIYLRGETMEKCSKAIFPFLDSTTIETN